jgi:hypothetical protein
MMGAEECKQQVVVFALLGTLRCVEEFLLGLPDPLTMEPIGCPETSVTKHQSMPANIPGKRRSDLNRGGGGGGNEGGA